MFIRQLSYLIALDRHRHFGRAAESCHVSQPALSMALSELERELGIAIIKRNRTFQGITQEGERVIAWAREMLGSLDGLRQEANLIRKVPGGHLAIGTIPSAIHPASLLCAEFRRVVSAMTMELSSLSTKDILRRLKEQELHVGLTYDQFISDETFDVLPLFVERYVLVARAGAALPNTLGWDEVASLPLSLLNHDMQNRHLLDDVFSKFVARPKVHVESNSTEVLLAEAASGRTYSIMPLSALPDRQADATIQVHRIAPEEKADVSLVRLRREAPLPLLDAIWRLAANMDLQAALDARAPKS